MTVLIADPAITSATPFSSISNILKYLNPSIIKAKPMKKITDAASNLIKRFWDSCLIVIVKNVHTMYVSKV